MNISSEEIQAGKFPKCTRDTNPQIPEVLQTPHRRNKKIFTHRHVTAELEKSNRKTVQAARGRGMASKGTSLGLPLTSQQKQKEPEEDELLSPKCSRKITTNPRLHTE